MTLKTSPGAVGGAASVTKNHLKIGAGQKLPQKNSRNTADPESPPTLIYKFFCLLM